MNGSNIILTGIPRSGTTLAAALIDHLSDSVCLNEPDWQTGRQMADTDAYARWLAEDFSVLRQKLVAGIPIADKRAVDHMPVTNYVSTDPNSGIMRTHFSVVPFIRPSLSSEFRLAIKHNGLYLALLPSLIRLRRFTIIAIIRHPLEVIHSWRRLQLPISRGQLPHATPYWPELAEVVSGSDALLAKQVKIYDLMCERIYNLREHIHVLPYEQLITTPETMCEYLGVSAEPKRTLIDTPRQNITEKDSEDIVAALKIYGEFYRNFYPNI